MGLDQFIIVGRETVLVIVLATGPVLVAALAVGVFMGIIQAATSINEMTLSFIPKLVAMAIAVVVFGSWQIQVLGDYIRGIFLRIPTLFS